VGCTGGPDSDEGTSPPASKQNQGTQDPAKSSDSTDPAADEDKSSSVGPECDAYFDCCDEVAKEQPSLAGSCDQTRKTVDDAVKKGASTETYESSCKQALATMQGAGYCK
jgi:hypothetical protein